VVSFCPVWRSTSPPKNYRNFKEVISKVGEAVAKRKQVEILYKTASTGKETTRKVNRCPSRAIMMSLSVAAMFILTRE
jgi:hypothetical protein